MTEPTTTGPIRGGARGRPFGAAAFDLAARGYAEEEWFFGGEATRYRHAPGTGRSPDGMWSAEPAGSEPFRTRLLVRRPRDPNAFNGTVVAFWTNVSNGFEIYTGESPELYRGYAFVGILTQRVGLVGYPTGANQGLAAWDPARYGGLALPDDDLSYDIYSQGLRLVGPDRPTGDGDPLGGLDVRHVVAFGASQSAGRLATHLDAVHPLAPTADAYLFDIYFGNGAPLETPPGAPSTRHVDDIPKLLATHGLPAGEHLLRTPADTKVFVVNSETESPCYRPVRQPDSDTYRLWEVAGHAHGTVPGRDVLTSSWERDLGLPGHPMAPASGGNPLSLEPVRSAALRRLQEWLVDGTPPPTFDRIAFDEQGDRIERDGDGNALGGLRLPAFATPVATTTGFAADGTLDLFGSGRWFDAGTLRERYGDEAGYLRELRASVDACVSQGTVLAEDAGDVIAYAVRLYEAAES